MLFFNVIRLRLSKCNDTSFAGKNIQADVGVKIESSSDIPLTPFG
jgi:hypothetical protein